MEAGTIALIVASLAAVSSLLNALVGLFQAWLDNRRLTISVEPDPWARTLPHLADLIGEYIVVLKILNRARTPNSVAQIRYRVDAKEQEFELEPRDFLAQTIAPFSIAQAALKLHHLPSDFQTAEFTVTPVRGKARTFTFTKNDLLPPF